jgi:hypothetical protein
MTIVDFESVYQTTDIHQFESILTKRYGEGINAFWLSFDSHGYPKIGLLVKGDLAYIRYIPKEYDAGFTSVGTVSELPGYTTTFHLTNTGDCGYASNEAVVPFSTALRAAKEFFFSNKLPTSVEWCRQHYSCETDISGNK